MWRYVGAIQQLKASNIKLNIMDSVLSEFCQEIIIYNFIKFFCFYTVS